MRGVKTNKSIILSIGSIRDVKNFVEDFIIRESIRVIVFDLDGVIIRMNKNEMITNIYERLREYIYIRYDYLTKLINYIEQKMLPQGLASRIDGVKVNKILLRILRLDNSDEYSRLLMELQYSKESSLGTLNYNAVHVLEEFRSTGVRILLFSDREINALRNTLRRHGIANLFDKVISASSIDPKGKVSIKTWYYLRHNLHELIGRINRDTLNTIYIGDNYYVDTIGAFTIGMPTVIVEDRDRYGSRR